MRAKRTANQRLLNKFLRENKCKRKFYRNFNAFNMCQENKEPNCESAICIIMLSFSWFHTPEKCQYWMDINSKWEEYLLRKDANNEC